jgi:heat shock protein HslJ
MTLPSVSRDPHQGTRWVAASIGSDPVVGEWYPSLAFEDDGRVIGHTGLNHFAGDYTVEGHRLALGPLRMTRTDGPPDAKAQELRFIAALSGPCAFEVDQNLTIRGDRGPVRFLPG